MIKKSIANLPLHGGKAPLWLFNRMKKMARQILLIIIKEYGNKEVLKRISDPFWFQALGCVLGFDWHSSGLTTTVNGAIKEALNGLEKDTGIFVAGGKGGKSRQTPMEIIRFADRNGFDGQNYVKISRLTAKVDSVAIQDGYQLYLHHIFFTKDGNWVVIQQGMNEKNKYARRYHWFSDEVESFVETPHKAICGDKEENEVLNMTAVDSREARETTLDLSRHDPVKVLNEIKIISTCNLPARHQIFYNDMNSSHIEKVLLSTYENQPDNFENLLLTRGFGPKAMRSLVLLSEIIYGKEPSYKDPITYSFAHGGKDGIPYPVDRKLYDANVEFLKEILNSSKIEETEKSRAFKRLSNFEVKGETHDIC
ncbi:MAG: DUF763 domain-containing protein [Candidatus Goldbacteria bacterium]|nr:DUF763 domain-containing protein [Candidatus Goldiibacteriota bacterium]